MKKMLLVVLSLLAISPLANCMPAPKYAAPVEEVTPSVISAEVQESLVVMRAELLK